MYGTSTDTTQQTQGNQKVNVFEMKTDGINSKLVSWAMQTGKGSYARNGLSIIAEDYEEKHPGWIVVAGINGDQYYTKYGSGLGADGSFYYPNQPYYPMIIDGERRFPVTPTGNSASNYVGIANNNSNDSFVPASQLSNVKIEVLNESDEVAVKHFLNNKIRFTDVFDLVEDIVHKFKNIKNPSLDDILNADKEARIYTEEKIKFIKDI